MKITPWVFLVMLFWMFITSGLVFGLYTVFSIPDEIAGPMLFLCIGIVISSTMNYYK
ncbi:MAG: hypothetical protein VX279_03390 [Candidatus Neomarinimicrobiota bacterium]|jgi:hypothetical protein|nr:hypothetical protein [Candidatus Neomarinimicrobiota bacterium]|tara:strand:+ start:754 stop:924 length:171 start_codon:yes stop_codon:yes gene_type:complete